VRQSTSKEDPTMTCPQCTEAREVAYAALSQNLICLVCDWEERLDEDEIFDLFFAWPRSRAVCGTPEHAGGDGRIEARINLDSLSG
jgi:hypothetical protein